MKCFALILCLILCVVFYEGDGGNTIECYYCINDCNETPLGTLTCYDVDNNISCYSSIYTTDNGGTENLKGCAIDADTDFGGFCTNVNDEGGSCYTCQEDLCNADN